MTSVVRALPENRQPKRKRHNYRKEKCCDFLSGFDNPAAAFRHLEASTKQQDDAIHIGTIHGSKGLEWETVFLIGCEEELLPHSLAQGFAQIEEERRLFYVAITRAKKSLNLSYLAKRGSVSRYPSPYISEMQSHAEINAGKVSDSDFSELLRKMRQYGRSDQFKKDTHPLSTSIADGAGADPAGKSTTLGRAFWLRLVIPQSRTGQILQKDMEF